MVSASPYIRSFAADIPAQQVAYHSGIFKTGH